MEIKSYEEQVCFSNVIAKKTTYYSDYNASEFYQNLEDDRLEKQIQFEFLKLIKEKTQDKKIALILKRKVGNSCVQKHFGIWNKLKKDGIIFEDNKTEKEKDGWLTGLAFPSDEELHHIFKPYSWLLAIGSRDALNQLYDKCSFDFDELAKEFLTHNCTIVEFVDIGVDGKILNFIEK